MNFGSKSARGRSCWDNFDDGRHVRNSCSLKLPIMITFHPITLFQPVITKNFFGASLTIPPKEFAFSFASCVPEWNISLSGINVADTVGFKKRKKSKLETDVRVTSLKFQWNTLKWVFKNLLTFDYLNINTFSIHNDEKLSFLYNIWRKIMLKLKCLQQFYA